MLLSEISTKLGARLLGDGNTEITGVNTIQDAGENEICFLSSSKHAKKLSESRAAAVLVSTALDDCLIPQVVADHVDEALIAVLGLFAPRLTPQQGIHPTAVVEPTARLDDTVTVGPNVYIGHGVTIGAGSIVGPGCSIGENTVIGSHCRLDSHVVIYHNCKIGNACVIQANSTIGSTGYGYSFIKGQHRLIPHNGGVILEDGVEIGANSCVDRAKFGDTVIGAGTKIDNLVQVAHNVKIGKCCLLTAQVGIAGSTVIGNGVIFAGHSGASDNLQIGDGAIIGLKTAAMRDVPPGQAMLGNPPQELRYALKCISVYQRLPELAKDVKQLHKKIEKLEQAKNDTI